MQLDQFIHPVTDSDQEEVPQIQLTGFRSYITGQEILFQSSELLAYLTQARDYMEELRPVGIRETQLAQRIIDTNWKLNRLDALEKALVCHLTAGASSVGHYGAEDRGHPVVSEAHAWQRDSGSTRTFDLMSKLEARLDRRITSITREFERLQDKRIARAKKDVFELERCNAYLFYLHEIPSARDTDDQIHDRRIRNNKDSQPQPKVFAAA